jgi:anti-sigma factor RsiW
VRNPFVRKHPFGGEALSSYLDRRLSPADSARLEKHLTSCELCRRQLEELRAVVEGLHALPSMPAPRSFALRPEQVEAPQRSTPIRLTAWAQRASAFAPAGVAVAALVVFLVLVGVDLGTLGGGGGAQGVAPPRSAKGAYESGEALSAAPAPTPAPALGAPAPSDEGRQAAGTPEPTFGAAAPTEAPEPTAGAAAPTEAPPPPLAPSGTTGGGGTGRWVLRGFQGFAGAAFLGAMAALVWQRRRRRGAGRT